MRAATLLTVLLASASTAVASPPRATPARSRVLATRPVQAGAGPSLHAGASASRWTAQIDRDTGVAAWLVDGHVDVPGATHDPARAERAARDFIREQIALLAPGSAPGDLVLVTNRLDGDVRTVAFAQRHRGLSILDAHVGVVIAHDRLFAAHSSAWPHVSVAAAQLDRDEVIVPSVGPGPIRYEPARVVEDDTWRIYVGRDGRELRRVSKRTHGTGTLTYNAGVRHGGGPRTTFPASVASITVNGTMTTTAPDGTFMWTGNLASTVIATTTGPAVRVINQEGSPATTTLTAQPNATTTWNAAGDELVDAQVSAFVYASIAKARARVINPAASTWLDQQLEVYVNESNPCSASSSGDSVHFSRATTSCANTAVVGDVVFHEVGHSLHANSLIAGMGMYEEHLSEGLSDFFAANITNDPAVGRGYFKTDEPLRDIDPVGYERLYPIDFDFDPHVSGLIIAGALWDLRKQLIAGLGQTAGIARTEKIFTGIMQRADDISTSYTAARIADDDDGNLANGTPNQCAIERAFGVHGLVPDYQATIVSPPRVTGLDIRVPVSIPTTASCPPPTLQSIVVTWRANDGVPSEISLVHDEPGSAWVGTFPEQENGTVLAFSVDARFDDGTVRSFPDNPADPRYQLFVGSATKIWCENFDEDPEWQQTSNAGFAWQWARTVADPGTHDPDEPVTGTYVLGTGVDGDGEYAPNSITSISTPMIDVSAYETVRLHYWRWLTIEDALYDVARITVNGDEVWTNASAPSGTFDHIDREWRFHDIDLTPHVRDGMVDIRWGLSSDFGKELGGWTLDDVCIVGLVKIPRCGDNEVDIGEQCDDGNNDSDDGCAADCIDEVTAGGGGCCSASGGGAGSQLLLVLGVMLALQRRRRASSLVPSRSVSRLEP